MQNPLLLPELRTMFAEGDDQGLTEFVTELHPASVAEFAEGLNDEEVWQVLAHANVTRQAEVFSFFPTDKQVAMAEGVGRERMSRLLEAMSHDDRVDLLKRLPEELVDSLLPLVAKADREDIRKLLSYPEHSVGSVMTTDYATLSPELSVQEAISRLRQQASQKETIYYVYVVDEERHLIGFVSLRDLILARPSATVRDILKSDDLVSVRVDQDREDVARKMAKYDFLAIPVVDEQNRIVGIVTYDDVLDVMEQEATEDQFRMAGVGPMEENFLEVPFKTVWRKRSTWLSCLFVAELATFTAMAYFEDAIGQILALSLFVPLCISTGGNSGAQAATLITRAMALGQISPSLWWKVLRHEVLMGLALGITLGVIGYLRAAVTPESVLRGTDRWQLALVIGLSISIICLWGTIVGSMVPMVMKKIGLDPGYASSPFVATFVDVTGIVIYFSIAQIYLL